MTAGQQIEYDEVMKRLGDLLYRNLGVMSKAHIFDSGKALVVGSGLRVEPSSAMTINVPSGVCFQRSIDVFPVLQKSDQTITLDAASGVPRVDIIEAQIKILEDKTDYAQIGTVATGTGGGSVEITNQEIMRDIKYYLAVQKKTGSTDATAATAGTLTGTVVISSTIDLSETYLLNIADGEDGSFQEIDCRGATPEATTRVEIISAINTVLGRTAASTGAGNVIVLTGNGTGVQSIFTIKPPVTDATKDALETIFGVSSGGIYKYKYTGVNEWFKLAEIDVGASTTVITGTEIRNIDEKSTWASGASDVDVRKHIYEEIDDLYTYVDDEILRNIPVGEIKEYSGLATTIPTGWLVADHSSLAKAGYPELWEVSHDVVGTFTVNLANPGVFTLNTHGRDDGDCVFLNTTGGLPTGLFVDTNYYVEKINDDTFYLHATQASAIAHTTGGRINTSVSQSGIHTLTYCQWGIDGADNFFLPDHRGVSTIGAGTQAGAPWGSSVYKAVLGGMYQDVMFPHWHNNNVDGGRGGSTGDRAYPTGASTWTTMVKDAISDTVHGTPRIDYKTQGPVAGVLKLIKAW